MRFIPSIIAVGLMLASGVADARTRLTGEARLAQLLDGRVAGKPIRCLSLRSIQSSDIVDHTAIVYRSGSTLYVNRPTNADQLDDDDILVTRTSIDSLCNIDVVNLVDRVGRYQRGFVSLNDFVPYRRPK